MLCAACALVARFPRFQAAMLAAGRACPLRKLAEVAGAAALVSPIPTVYWRRGLADATPSQCIFDRKVKLGHRDRAAAKASESESGSVEPVAVCFASPRRQPCLHVSRTETTKAAYAYIITASSQAQPFPLPVSVT